MAVYGYTVSGLRQNLKIRLKATFIHNPAKSGLFIEKVSFWLFFSNFRQFLTPFSEKNRIFSTIFQRTWIGRTQRN
jgi:hypothetical protein